MLRPAKLCGVSFYSRNRRRRLVVMTYGCVVVYVVGSMFAPVRVSAALWSFLGLFWTLFPVVLFGALVRQETMPDRARQNLLELGMARPVLGTEGSPDEFEATIRNAAYFKAYRVMVWVGTALTILVAGMMAVGGAARVLYANYAFVLMVASFLSLPQAIILWEMKDWVEE